MMYPVSGKSEIQEQGVSLNISGPPEIARSHNYYINTRGIFYPEIPALPRCGPTIRGKYVPSPLPGNWLDCTAAMMFTDQLYCHGLRRRQLVTNLENAGYGNPSIADPALRPQRFEAHHIQQIGWGGSNEAFNGVWLPKVSHQELINWFNKSSFKI